MVIVPVDLVQATRGHWVLLAQLQSILQLVSCVGEANNATCLLRMFTNDRKHGLERSVKQVRTRIRCHMRYYSHYSPVMCTAPRMAGTA